MELTGWPGEPGRDEVPRGGHRPAGRGIIASLEVSLAAERTRQIGLATDVVNCLT
jgi:hypothetical protein